MSDLPQMLRALARVFPNGPSWPFRTQSARSVWEEAEKLLERSPDMLLHLAVREATWKANVPACELTPEDYATLSMALRWKARQLEVDGRREKARLFGFGAPALPKPGTKR